MHKLLIICGPTATGKTNLALKFAPKFNGEIISADSRQLYRHMGIGTGRGVDTNFTSRLSTLKFHSNQLITYSNEQTQIWGHDLADPNDSFTAADYQYFFTMVSNFLYSKRKLPILVGGTGLYLQVVTQPLLTTKVPPNHQLRHHLSSFSLSKLQHHLQTLNPDKFSAMNQSDRHNPRRLIRAIEISTQTQSFKPNHSKVNQILATDQLWIGLTAPLEFLKDRILINIRNRINQNLDQEITNLDSLNFNWHSQAATATGYHFWRLHRTGQINKQRAINLWHIQETQLAKRQLTWFKKQKQITWFDITLPNSYSNLEQHIKAWYSTLTHHENQTPHHHPAHA